MRPYERTFFCINNFHTQRCTEERSFVFQKALCLLPLSPMDSQTKKLFVSYPKTTLNYIILADKKGGEIQNTNLDDRHSKHTKKLEQQAIMAEGERRKTLSFFKIFYYKGNMTHSYNCWVHLATSRFLFMYSIFILKKYY